MRKAFRIAISHFHPDVSSAIDAPISENAIAATKEIHFLSRWNPGVSIKVARTVGIRMTQAMIACGSRKLSIV
jgi:hypothetical protein